MRMSLHDYLMHYERKTSDVVVSSSSLSLIKDTVCSMDFVVAFTISNSLLNLSMTIVGSISRQYWICENVIESSHYVSQSYRTWFDILSAEWKNIWCNQRTISVKIFPILREHQYHRTQQYNARKSLEQVSSFELIFKLTSGYQLASFISFSYFFISFSFLIIYII